MSAIDWTVIETAEAKFNPTQLHHKETVFSLGNGYMGTRGTFEEGYLNANPATLVNGVYDDAPISPEIVNCPNWLPLVILIDSDPAVDKAGHRFRLDQGTVLSYQRWLDMRRGILSRRVRWRSPAGHTLDLWFERFISLADPHVAALRCRILPLDFDAPIEVQASIDGYADNEGLHHWEWVDQAGSKDSAWLHVQTRHSKVHLGMATRLTVAEAEAVTTQTIGFQKYPTVVARFMGRQQQPVMIEKLVTVFTSRDTETPAQSAWAKLAELPDYATLLKPHEDAWAALWQRSDVVIEGDVTAQLAVRFNLFQILAAAPQQDDRVSIPAKTLSGFAYRGHIFWDTEIFILPFLTFTQPALARNLLTYRYHMLAGARRKAKASGYEGAMYVWESADTGDEVTPRWLPRPNSKELVRIWCGDIELHISADVAYAVYQYWQATGDDDWMKACGAEIILDTAVFWGSRAEWNSVENRYEIKDVIGPDEYHERVNNNAFTNRIAQWHLQTAIEVWSWLRRADADRAKVLETELNLTIERLHHWKDAIEKMYVPMDAERGLIEQFQGFFKLEDVNLAEYEPRHTSMQVIFGIEGANEHQAIKQADVLMLLYLLRRSMFVNSDPSPEAAARERQLLQANWDYYEPRTDHTYGSSLGPPVHAILACDLGKPNEAYEHFMRSALVDLSDVRGNAAEGIHGASAGGIWQALVLGFGGLSLIGGRPAVTPRLPQTWKRLKFQVQWRGQAFDFDLTQEPSQMMPTAQPTAIQGVIFDLDGVLTDTSEFHYLGWKRLADEAGIPFDRHTNEELRGVSRRDSLLRLLNGRNVSDEQFQEMMDRKNRYYIEYIKGITSDHLLPGVRELLQDLRSAGVKVAIGSASKNARDVVERLGIADLVDAIADGYSVQHSKPAPDVFLFAAAELGLDPAACVVVEDAESGVEAARRAKMRVVGLGPTSRVGAADVVLPSLANTRWADLQTQLTNLQPKSRVVQYSAS